MEELMLDPELKQFMEKNTNSKLRVKAYMTQVDIKSTAKNVIKKFSFKEA